MHSHGIKYFTKDRLIEDVLHGMALGVEQSYNGYVLQLVATLNVFGSQKSIQDERHHDTIVELRSRIRTYYKDGAKLNPLHKWSKIDKLTLGMLGTLDSPSLHAKGGVRVFALSYRICFRWWILVFYILRWLEML